MGVVSVFTTENYHGQPQVLLFDVSLQLQCFFAVNRRSLGLLAIASHL